MKKVTKIVLTASLVGMLTLALVASPAGAAWLETFDGVPTGDDFTNANLPGWDVPVPGHSATSLQALSSPNSALQGDPSLLTIMTRPTDANDDTLYFSWYIKPAALSPGPSHIVSAADSTTIIGALPDGDAVGLLIDTRPISGGLDTFHFFSVTNLGMGPSFTTLWNLNGENLAHEQWYDGRIRTRPFEHLVDLAYKLSSSDTWIEQNDTDRLDFNFRFVTLVGAGSGDDNKLALYDNVGTQAIPEPSSLALLALGLLGMAGYVWRKRR